MTRRTSSTARAAAAVVGLALVGGMVTGCGGSDPRRDGQRPTGRPPEHAATTSGPAAVVHQAGTGEATLACRRFAAALAPSKDSVHAASGRKAAWRAAETAQRQNDVWKTFATSLQFLASLPSTSLTQDEIARAKVERNNVRSQCANLHVTVPDQ